MFEFNEPLETERLVLRPFTLDDHADVFAIRADAELTRWIPTKASTPEEVDEILRARMANLALSKDDDVLSLAAVRRSDGWLAGDMTLFLRSAEHRQGELGYVFKHEAQGQGLATEAAEAVLRFGFEVLGLHRIFAIAYAANSASTAVMARLGMTPEALHRETECIDGVWHDDVTWSILEHEWRARQAER